MSEKELLIVGGPNGAGKTTIALEYASRQEWLYLSADAIAERLSPGNPTAAQVAAGVEFTRHFDAAIQAGDNLIIESTLAGLTLRRRIVRAKHAGFTITIVFVYLDGAEGCIERVKERVQKGGHSVPVAHIHRRFHRSVSNFWNLYRQLADHWQLMYNSGTQPIEVATGDATDITVHDAPRLLNFKRLVEGADCG